MGGSTFGFKEVFFAFFFFTDDSVVEHDVGGQGIGMQSGLHDGFAILCFRVNTKGVHAERFGAERRGEGDCGLRRDGKR
jgi:hypothetical protein